jgi:hypothetical protein
MANTAIPPLATLFVQSRCCTTLARRRIGMPMRLTLSAEIPTLLVTLYCYCYCYYVSSSVYDMFEMYPLATAKSLTDNDCSFGVEVCACTCVCVCVILNHRTSPDTWRLHSGQAECIALVGYVRLYIQVRPNGVGRCTAQHADQRQPSTIQRL